MPFTARIGTPDSQPGRLEPGQGAGPLAPQPIRVAAVRTWPGGQPSGGPQVAAVATLPAHRPPADPPQVGAVLTHPAHQPPADPPQVGAVLTQPAHQPPTNPAVGLVQTVPARFVAERRRRAIVTFI